MRSRPGASLGGFALHSVQKTYHSLYWGMRPGQTSIALNPVLRCSGQLRERKRSDIGTRHPHEIEGCWLRRENEPTQDREHLPVRVSARHNFRRETRHGKETR
jgi:hypothetical protein